MLRIGSVVGLVAITTMGCATKGYVNRQVQAATDNNRTAWTTADNAVKADVDTKVTALRSGLDSVKTDVAGLRTDLTGLRNEFGAKIVALEEGLQFAFPVTFAFDDATVRTEDRAALDRFAQVINKHYGGSVVTVEGFADPAGSADYNRRLSAERAENVIAYLRQAGITGVTLRPVGMGETRLVVNGASDDMPGAQANRRVVFVIESAKMPVMAGGN